jgi:hypothetical protein
MFTLGDYAFDRIQYGVAESSDDILYTLSQLADATIDISSESKEVKDKDGNLIRKVYTNKSGTFTANNALMNTNIQAASSGSPLNLASNSNVIDMPKILTVKKGETITLTDYVEGTVHVCAQYENGASGDTYTQADSASATAFGLSEAGVLTPPTPEGDDAPTTFLVKFDRKRKEGAVVANNIDNFPSTVKLTLKALIIDPCYKDGVKSAYIVLPSFQVSPETSIALQTDSQLEYKGDLQVDYCSGNKDLYQIYFPEDDEEDE